MSKFGYVAAFAIGCGLGSAVTLYLVKDKYARLAEDEIESVREVYSDKDKTSIHEPIKEHYTNPREYANKPDIMEYAKKLGDSGYMDYSKPGAPMVEEEQREERQMPYVIAPEEFGEFGSYEKISLTYFADGTLADDRDRIIEDVDEIVGEDFADHFGEYEDDSVFIRNDILEADYEILKDERTYDEMLEENPHPVEIQ